MDQLATQFLQNHHLGPIYSWTEMDWFYFPAHWDKALKDWYHDSLKQKWKQVQTQTIFYLSS